jgi:hypothetical protein
MASGSLQHESVSFVSLLLLSGLCDLALSLHVCLTSLQHHWHVSRITIGSSLNGVVQSAKLLGSLLGSCSSGIESSYTSLHGRTTILHDVGCRIVLGSRLGALPCSFHCSSHLGHLGRRIVPSRGFTARLHAK